MSGTQENEEIRKIGFGLWVRIDRYRNAHMKTISQVYLT